jgi:hypothetical protein
MVFRERGWMTEMWVVEMLCGRAMRMSPQALKRMTAVGRGASAGSKAEGWLEGGGDAVRCTARRKILFRMKDACGAKHAVVYGSVAALLSGGVVGALCLCDGAQAVLADH